MLGNNMFRSSKTPPPFRETSPQPQSPYSWGRNSNDGLMSSPTLDDSPPSESDAPPPVPKHAPKDLKGFEYLSVGEQHSNGAPLPTPTRPALRTQNSFSRSGADGDADARMVRESFIAREQSYSASPLGRPQNARASNLLQPPSKTVSAMSSDNSLHTASTSSSGSTTPLPVIATSRHTRDVTPVSHPGAVPGTSSTNTTPRAAKARPTEYEDEPLFDSSIASAILAAETHSSLPSQRKQTANKVMTAAEFKQKQKMMPASGKDAAESDSGDDYEDDEDDPKILAQQRRLREEKEAKHMLWRQQMKKEIGDQSVPDPSGFSNRSTPHFSLNGPSVGGADVADSEEDDSDTPLAILVAHGFPGKNNPPDPRHSANSFVGVRPISQVGGTPSRPSSGRLPPFARGLPGPEDIPYVGASNLVNPVNRQSLGMNRLGAPSVYGGSAMEVNPIVPPGGLVGIIAEEERMKSMRRGSPNSGGNFNKAAPRQSQQANIQQMTMGMGMPVGGMGSPYGMMPPQPQMGGGGFDQHAFNQQMMAIMQQQNQLIQSMTQMGYGAPPGMPPMGMQGMPMGQMQGMPMPGLSPQSRPMSVMSNMGGMGGPNVGSRPPLQQARTMSMAGPRSSMPPRSMTMGDMQYPPSMFAMQNPNYTPSIAPSERSNLGQPGRYRPVNTAKFNDGGSTITAGSTYQPSNPDFLSATIHNGKKTHVAQPVEDEEEGWSTHADARRNTRRL
jgi:hypothetical protein